MAQPKNINNAILGVLESIDAKLDKQATSTAQLNTNLEGMANTGVVSEDEYKSFAKFFGDLAKGLTTLVKAADKISEKSAENLKGLLLNIGEGISSFFKEVEPGQIDEFSAFLRGLGPTIFIFAVSMTLSLPFLLLAPISALMLGLTIKALLYSLGEMSDENVVAIAGMQAVLNIGAGILLFSLAMLVFLPISPIVMLGAVMFGYTVKILLAIMQGTANPKNMKAKAAAMESIFSMAKGILLFSLAMLLFIPLSPIVILGVVMFGLTIKLLLWIIGASGKNAKSTAKGIGSILDLAKGILLFALAMIVTVLLFPVILLGALVFALTLLILNMGLKLVQGKKARQGVISLLILAGTILAFGLIIALIGAIVTWTALAKTAVMIGGLALILYIVGMGSKIIEKGAIAMLFAAGVVVAMAIAMLIWKVASPEWMDILKLAATIVVMGLIGLVAGLGPIPGFIFAGSAALIVAGGAVIAMAIGMLIWTAAKVEWKDVGTLGATIAMIGVEMGLLGLASPFIFAGAAAMLVASIPVIAIAGALAVFKAAKWNPKTDSESFISAMGAIVSGFLGGEMPGGLVAGLKFAAKAAARAALLFVTVPPFLLAGAALLPITASLLVFKKAKWTQTDSDNMEYVMAAIIKAFSLPSDEKRQKEMGFYVSPWRLYLGIMSLKNAGSTMASLAEGVQAFANLTVPIYGWVDKEGGGSLEIIERRSMNEDDFTKAAEGMAKVISAVAKPFAEVGRLEQGESTGNPILDRIFSGNFVSKGVSALRNSGDTIVSLAEGVQGFANLTIPVYGLVDHTDENGNTNKKLMVIERKAMSETDIQNASDNIAKVIGVIAQALADVGRMESESSGIFSNGYVRKGAEALAGVGDNIKAIADTVKGYAYMEVNTMKLINAGTKDAQLVPGEPIVLKEEDLTNAATTLGKVIGIVVKAIADVGRMEDESSGWFSDGYVEKGKNALGNIGENIANIADAVLGFATAQFTPMGVDNDGNLVPTGETVRLGQSELKAAARTLGDVISIMGWEVYYFGKAFESKQYYLEVASKVQGTVSEVINKVRESIDKLEKVTVQIAETFVEKMRTIFLGTYEIFSAENTPDAVGSAVIFKLFSENMVNIARESGGIVKAGEGFTSMATASTTWVNNINQLKGDNANRARWLIESMTEPNAWKGAKSISISTVRLKEQINGLDLERLKILNSLMCALAKLGSTDVGLDKLGEELGEGMREGFELLAEYLAQLLEQGAGGGGGAPGSSPATASGGGGGSEGGGSSKPASGSPAPPAPGGLTKSDVIAALQSVTMKVKASNGSF